MKKIKAVSLISGGLDSMLATKIVMDQGVHVEGVNFFTGFCGKRPRCSNNDCEDEITVGSAKHVAKTLGIPLHRLNIFEEYKEVVSNPRYGYGAHLNPCLDCRIFMVKKTLEWMRKNDFDFIISGEVMGQRPMSQLKDKLPIVEKRADVKDILLRPLSAKLLLPTLPEREGWVNREELYGISGRSRKEQLKLVKEFGIKEFAQPSGGCCLLINDQYCARLRDLWELRGNHNYSLADLVVLKAGRHIRPKPNFKLIVGRDEEDNTFLEAYATSQYATMECVDYPGPLTLIEGELSEEDVQLAARIVARYVSHKGAEQVKITYKNNDVERELKVTPFEPGDILSEWMIGDAHPAVR